MDKCRVKQKKRQSQGKDHDTGDGSYGIAAAEAGSKEHEVTNGLPIGAVEPEKVAVLVDDEHFDGQAQSERPFPFGHDGLSGADHDQDFRPAGSEQPVEAAAASSASVFVDRVNGDILEGTSSEMKFVKATGADESMVGTFVPVRVTKAMTWVLEGEVGS